MLKPIIYIFVWYNIISEFQSQDFCTYTGQLVTVYRIGQNIYFGGATRIWTFNIPSKSLLKRRRISALFQKNQTNEMKTIITALHFGYNPCDKTHSKEFCDNAVTSKDLVIFISHDILRAYGKYLYSSYRLSDDKVSFISINDSDMPWNMSSKGKMTDNHILKVIEGTIILGMSLLSYEHNHIIYGVFTNNRSKTHYISERNINDGIPEHNWRRILSYNFSIYGLFSYGDSVFVLDRTGKMFYRNLLNMNALKMIERISAKELFNCYNTSTYFDETDSKINSEYTSVSTESSRSSTKTILISYPKYNTILSTSNEIHGKHSKTNSLIMPTTVLSPIKSSKSKSFLYIWLLLFVTAIVLMLLLATVICYLSNKKASEKRRIGSRFNSEDSVN